MTKPVVELKTDIELSEQDLLDLITNRGVRKGGLILKIDPLFFMGVSEVRTIIKKIYDMTAGARL